MNEKKYRLSSEMSLAVPVDDADRLLALSDGSAALLYLYALRRGGGFSLSDAAKDLRRTENEISKTLSLLKTAGLLSDQTSGVALPRGEMPEYDAEDIVLRSRDDGQFEAIVEETQLVIGRTLSGADLKVLFGIYDNLGLPAEVIFLIEHYCDSQAKSIKGPGGRTSMRAIENEAARWFNREILTIEQAEDYLLQLRERAESINVVRRILQLSGRAPTPTEKKYMESWLEMGFDTEAIAMAYDRTVVKTGSLQWKYMNSILKSWDSKALHSVDEIEAGDGRTTGQGSASSSGVRQSAGPVAPDSERLKKMMDKL